MTNYTTMTELRDAYNNGTLGYEYNSIEDNYILYILHPAEFMPDENVMMPECSETMEVFNEEVFTLMCEQLLDPDTTYACLRDANTDDVIAYDTLEVVESYFALLDMPVYVEIMNEPVPGYPMFVSQYLHDMLNK